MRSLITGFRVTWWKEDLPELRQAFAELQRSHVGHMARLAGTAGAVEPGAT